MLQELKRTEDVFTSQMIIIRINVYIAPKETITNQYIFNNKRSSLKLDLPSKHFVYVSILGYTQRLPIVSRPRVWESTLNQNGYTMKPIIAPHFTSSSVHPETDPDLPLQLPVSKDLADPPILLLSKSKTPSGDSNVDRRRTGRLVLPWRMRVGVVGVVG